MLKPTIMKNSLLFLFVTMSFLLDPLSSFAQQKTDKNWENTVKKYQELLSDAGIIGSSFYLIQDGAVADAEHYGLADQQSNTPVDENTIFHWASITKTFTGIAIMQLRDRGLLKLDDPVVDYLPELKKVHNPYGPIEAITIRQLLSHSAGFRASTWPWGGGEDWHPYEPTTWEQLVAMLPYTKIQFEPGSRYSYSNPGIIFLGRIIELLSGEDIEVYLDKNILRPLGMHHTYFDHTPPYLLKHRSNNYYSFKGKLITNGRDFDTGITVSNGGLNAPLSDMIRYLNFLLDTGEKENHAYILKRSSLEEMWQIQHPVEKNASFQENIGLAYFIMNQQSKDGKTHQFIGHTGSQRGFQSFFYIHPSSRSAAILVMNTDVFLEDNSGNTFSETRRLLLQIRTLVFESLIGYE